MADQTQTIEIDNFTGALTRSNTGELNSGFAKFSKSWGYDPFSKPGNLTWFYQPTDIAGAVITDAVLAAKIYSPSTSTRYVFAIGNAGRLYQIDATNVTSANNPLYDTPTLLTTLSASSPTFVYGGNIEFYNGKIYISSDALLTTTDFSGGSETVVTGGSLTSALPHPMIQFAGNLYIGNGNNIAKVDSTNLFTSVSFLIPSLPTGMYIRDLDVTPDGNYMVITASYVYPPKIDAATYLQPYSSDSVQFYWNGTDKGATAEVINPSWTVTALNTFLDKKYYFMNDAFGTALFENSNKLFTLPQNTPPMPFGASANGEFLTWAAPEITGTITNASKAGTTFTSLYYYGQLDAQNKPGLWRVLRQAPTAGVVWRNALNMMVNSFSFSINNAIAWGKHYISVFEIGTPNTFHLYRWVLPPSADTAPLLGVYETQTKIFPKKVAVKQVRVYTEPTVASNGFQIDLIGSDGNVISNGTKTYTFSAGSDPTLLQGALDRIDLPFEIAPTYALGIRITNTGTVNMTILKIEIDVTPAGK